MQLRNEEEEEKGQVVVRRWASKDLAWEEQDLIKN